MFCCQAEAEEKERRRKEKMEAHLYTIIKVARDQDFKHQIGTNQFFDLVDNDKVLLHILNVSVHLSVHVVSHSFAAFAQE